MADRAAAFFDVDNTLVRGETLFSFVRYCLPAVGRSTDELDETIARMRRLREAGTPRLQTNRLFYTILAGIPAGPVAVLAEQWWEELCASPRTFHEPVCANLREHAAANLMIVLVSGSFPACLAPIARYFGAHQVICTEPIIEADHYTGDVTTAMIGSNKAVAVSQVLHRHNLSSRDSFAYGDHSSDIDFMSLVGNPVAVAPTDQQLASHAATHNWPTIGYKETQWA